MITFSTEVTLNTTFAMDVLRIYEAMAESDNDWESAYSPEATDLGVEMDIINDPGIYWRRISQTFNCPVTKYFRFAVFHILKEEPKKLVFFALSEKYYPLEYSVNDLVSEKGVRVAPNPLPEKWHLMANATSIIEFTMLFTRNGRHNLQAIITDLESDQLYFTNTSSFRVQGISLLIL